ncbi:MAG: hypothetical protein KBS76_07325 [Ruminococcus sp.]|nr:hypothetical protein [Candidatus Apopatosoma intestinale]
MAIITNQASVSYAYGERTARALSNVAETVLVDPVTVTKRALGTTYRAGDEVTYILTARNGTAAPITDLTVTDDLGTFTSGGVTVTPLSYIGPAYLYINGTFVNELTPTVRTDSITFTLPTVPVGANVMIVYKARINEYAPLAQANEIDNTAMFESPALRLSQMAQGAIQTESYADVRIVKTMTPNPVSDGGRLTYILTISNYGNEDATDVTLTDTFTPAPTGITVSVDGVTVPPALYSYTGGTLTLPAACSSQESTIPAATYTRDPATGVYTVNPGTVTVTVTGTI